MSQQVLPEAQQAVSRFNTVTGNLQDFTHEINRNPAMLIRGRQPAAPGPGEK